MAWEVRMTDGVHRWFASLDLRTANLVAAAIDQLADEGPQLRRPLADRIKGSSIKNMKELRPGSSGRSEIRVLFVFDPQQRAILLVAGDKSGQWQRWYTKSIPLAEQRYKQWLKDEGLDKPKGKRQ